MDEGVMGGGGWCPMGALGHCQAWSARTDEGPEGSNARGRWRGDSLSADIWTSRRTRAGSGGARTTHFGELVVAGHLLDKAPQVRN